MTALAYYIQECIRAAALTKTAGAVSELPLIQPEHASPDVECRMYPSFSSEHMFVILWDMMRESNHVCAAELTGLSSRYGEEVLSPNVQTHMHSHAYLELIYVASGEYHQNILDRKMVLKQGDFCLIDKNCPHCEQITEQPATVLFLGISDRCLKEIMHHNALTQRIASFLQLSWSESKTLRQYLHFTPHPGESAAVQTALHTLLKELQQYDEASPLICQGLLLRILHILGKDYLLSLEKTSNRPDNHVLFEEITEYMNANLKTISILQLSSHFHFQEDYFNRLFKNQIGRTYTEYLQLLRLRRAGQLLLTTDYIIDRIAAEVGYHNKGYFYKIFAEKYHMTPAQYRRNNGAVPAVSSKKRD